MSQSQVVIFSTALGPQHGGINSFNSEFCYALASIGVDVIVVVLTATRAQIAGAQGKGIFVVCLDIDAEEFTSVHIAAAAESLERNGKSAPSLWVGHDAITGPVALDVRGRVASSAPCLIFHHMSYRSYKTIEGDSTEVAKKHRHQQLTLEGADFVAAVGPRLMTTAQDLLRQSGDSSPHVFEVVPGLPDIPIVNAPHQFSLLFAGRLSGKSAKLKQANLGLAAFGHAVKHHLDALGPDPILTLLGVDTIETERAAYRALVQQHADRHATIIEHPYTTDRAAMMGTLSEQSAAMLLSVHEGFGLTGWESIGVSVPLIVSKNSGVYELLSRDIGGSATGCVRAVDIHASLVNPTIPADADIEEVSARIVEIARRPENARRDARFLRERLAGYTWEAMARKVIMECRLRVQSSSPASTETQNVASPRSLLSTVLFDVFQPDCEPYYITRSVDAQVRPVIYNSHIWASGVSGAGKTTLLRHTLLRKSGYQFLSLAGCVGQPVLEMLRFIAAETTERLDGQAVDVTGKSSPWLIHAIAKCLAAQEAPCFLHIDEIPLDSADKHRGFCEMVIALLTDLAGLQPAHGSRVVISTIDEPSIHPSQIRIRERLSVVRVSRWTDADLESLIDVAAKHLSLAIEHSSKIDIVRAAKGSPRFVKICIRKMVLYARQHEWSLMRLLDETRGEVIQ